MFELLGQNGLDFFTARRTFLVLKELKLQAAFIFALHHQCFAAALTDVLNERHAAAVRAGNIEGPAAPGTDTIALLDDAKAGGAVVAKRAVVSASVAETRVRIDKIPAVNTGLFVKRHRRFLRFLCVFHHKRKTEKNQSVCITNVPNGQDDVIRLSAYTPIYSRIHVDRTLSLTYNSK
jgi:hypothetical protein